MQRSIRARSPLSRVPVLPLSKKTLGLVLCFCSSPIDFDVPTNPTELDCDHVTCSGVRDIAVRRLKTNFYDAPHFVSAIDAAFAPRIKLERLSKRVLRGRRSPS